MLIDEDSRSLSVGFVRTHVWSTYVPATRKRELKPLDFVHAFFLRPEYATLYVRFPCFKSDLRHYYPSHDEKLERAFEMSPGPGCDEDFGALPRETGAFTTETNDGGGVNQGMYLESR